MTWPQAGYLTSYQITSNEIEAYVCKYDSLLWVAYMGLRFLLSHIEPRNENVRDVFSVWNKRKSIGGFSVLLLLRKCLSLLQRLPWYNTKAISRNLAWRSWLIQVQCITDCPLITVWYCQNKICCLYWTQCYEIIVNLSLKYLLLKYEENIYDAFCYLSVKC